jgi:5-methyltetrahydrofolate--homocysteine methyltransferase
MDTIRERLQRGDVIVGDGALGTMLMKRGLKHGDAPETTNLNNPEILQEMAALYFDAGAEIISTNTFGASPLRLQQFSLEKQVEAINRNAVAAVRKAVGDKAYISASIGPSSRMFKPAGNAEREEVFESFRQQLSILLSEGVDLVCIETMMNAAEAELAIKAAKSVSASIPVMATMTFNKVPKGFFTIMGTSIKVAAQQLEQAGADIIGSNCGNGMVEMVQIAREFRDNSKLPIAIQGNAGLPTSEGGELIYAEKPEFMASKAAELLAIGVQIIGGCCGTTPEHIRAIRKVVDEFRKV